MDGVLADGARRDESVMRGVNGNETIQGDFAGDRP